ncbi:YbaB/EbfC family nucleoid-associated protein [Paenirhodobacter sp.]|uniref:YbaB/EbfC family nucleoid-associated protein n=1 Tax=Paenirhodobacter sp. TaxID=1965326 RepID=UPI003B3EDC38
MFKGLGQLGDMAKMMKAAKEMQERMATLQEDLGRIVVTGEAGAGLVQARATARGELTGLNIDPSILVASEKEIVEDLILAAIKDAQGRAAIRAQDEQRKLLSELGLPADMNLPPL